LKKILTESSSGGKTIKLRDAIKRSFEKKDKAEEGSNDNKDGDGSLVEGMNSSKRKNVREVVTPLAHMSYPDQLEHKKSTLTQTLKRLVRFLSFLYHFLGIIGTCVVRV
jgi:tRNA (uracil-5-)-methyltransferase